MGGMAKKFGTDPGRKKTLSVMHIPPGREIPTQPHPGNDLGIPVGRNTTEQ